MATGVVAATLVLSKCARDVNNADDPARAVKAAASCVPMFDSALAGKLGKFLYKRSVARAAAGGRRPPLGRRRRQGRGRGVGRASIFLALIGPAFSGMNYFAATQTDIGARTVHVFPKSEDGIPPELVGRWTHHDFTVTFMPHQSARVLLWGCEPLLNGSCSVIQQAKVTPEGNGVRITAVKVGYIPAGADPDTTAPLPDGYWTEYGTKRWGDIGDYTVMKPTKKDGVWMGTSYFANGTQAYESFGMCTTSTPASVTASGICGA